MKGDKQKKVKDPNEDLKVVFTVVGSIQEIGDKKQFVPNSPGHYRTQIQKLFPGTVLWAEFSQKVPARSRSQLAYHWVLMGYLSDHTGYTKEEAHDWILRLKFGEKDVTIAGITRKIRESISDSAKMPLALAAELIEYDLEICAHLGITVPTAEELGYVSNTKARPLSTELEYPEEEYKEPTI